LMSRQEGYQAFVHCNLMSRHEQDKLVETSDDEESILSAHEIRVPETMPEKRYAGQKASMVIIALMVPTIIGSFLLVVIPGESAQVQEAATLAIRLQNSSSLEAAKQHPIWQTAALGGLIGLDRQYKLQASIFALVSFFCVVCAVLTSSVVVLHDPDLVPGDFHEKGTLSNVSQDVREPHGRLFSVALFTSGMLMVSSMYTFWLYRPWAPTYNPLLNPLDQAIFEGKVEHYYRALWVILPNVGFMFTAAIPSLSDSGGYKFALMLTHNLCAPIAMAFNIIMESIQLNYGENAFAYFFSDQPTPVYGVLTRFQRARVVVVSMAWVAVLIFLSLQTYLGTGSMLGKKIKTSYDLALASFFAEVFCMVLVAALPALAGLGTQFDVMGLPPVMNVAYAEIAGIHNFANYTANSR